jgi:hypothetical protein
MSKKENRETTTNLIEDFLKNGGKVTTCKAGGRRVKTFSK